MVVSGFSMHVLLLAVLLGLACADWKYANSKQYPQVPSYGPQPNAPYMVDNTHNYYHVAPDKGKQNGASWRYSGNLHNYLANLRKGKVMRGGYHNPKNESHIAANLTTWHKPTKRADSGSSYWLTSLAPLGSQPLAGPGYKFFRNVVEDYGADSSGGSDATEAINAAIADGDRCGESCGNTFEKGAIVYFPPGTYKICTPVIQLYYTQFIGDVNNPPTIKGCDNFTGIALFDTDPYIPGGSGAEWYVNQNQFFRHIRNFIFDLTDMPDSTDDNGQPLVPTGIHWQVAQATTLQNLVFNMPNATDDSKTSAVGIFTENGSGGFVSDLTFNGGNIGWRAGSQQYTARNLRFQNCLTAVQMVWDWGWVWQSIYVGGGSIAFNISGVGGISGQGIGSMSLVDSTISNVPVGILTNNHSVSPNIVLDNVEFDGVSNAVQVEGGDTLLDVTGLVVRWATGKAYNGSKGEYMTGSVTAPAKPKSLYKDGTTLLFVRSRPQYESLGTGDFLVATTDGKCKNDGTGDQADCLNTFLQNAVSAGKVAYFPAGIYLVGGTVFIPTGSRVQGSSWSQIQGGGFYFANMLDPKVMVQVGNKGDVGSMEIVEMLFSVKGNTEGAVLMEWNTQANGQGSAAMWDSHFRVGGASGTDLGIDTCPKHEFNEQCIAASLMLHVTSQASGYFENVWAWVADHDNDDSLYNNPDTTASQISVYGARGMLIESQGPSWFYGTSSEHSVLYNYQLSGAKNIYMGHIQTETPYYQPNPIAPAPFNNAKGFPNDPDFSSCNGSESCAASWGLRVVDSSNVTIHGAGLYSFFQDYYQDCLDTHDCQERILEVTGSQSVVIFNLFTVATSQLAVGIDHSVLYQNESQQGFTTEDSVWLPLDGEDNVDTIFVGPPVFTSTTVTCAESSCLLVIPTSPLSQPATVSPLPYTTSIEYGSTSSVTTNGRVTVTFITTTTTTVLTIPPVTISGLPYSNINATSGQTSLVASPSVDLPPVTLSLPAPGGKTTTRVVPVPPWPEIDGGTDEPATSFVGTGTSSSTYYAPVTSTVTVTGATVTTITFPATIPPTTISCPPDSSIVFATPSITILTDCPTPTTWAIGFNCPTTEVITFLGATTAAVSVDCSLITLWTGDPTSTPPVTTPTTTTPLPVWSTWPPGIITPISQSVPTPEATNGGTNQPCHLWFFWICIDHGPDIIGGWFWSFPPGIYGPAPPPPIDFPPGYTLKGNLPPWPRITIGQDHQLTYSEEPNNECQTEEASICSTTTSYLVTENGGKSTTTATHTESDCETIRGCSVSYSTAEFTQTSVAACSSSPGARRRNEPVPTPHVDPEQWKRANDGSGCEAYDAIVYPKDPTHVGDIPGYLDGLVYDQIQSKTLGYTAYFWVQGLPEATKYQLELDSDVAQVYYYYQWNQNNPPPNPPALGVASQDKRDIEWAMEAAELLDVDGLDADEYPYRNATSLQGEDDIAHLWKRDATSSKGDYYNDALVSLPPNVKWKSAASGSFDTKSRQYQYYYDDSAGEGVTVYAIGEPDVWTNHPEFEGNVPRALTAQSNYGNVNSGDVGTRGHASSVCASISGKQLGTCKKCKVVYSGHPVPQDNNADPRDWYLEDLLSAYDDMHSGGRTPQSSVINMSFGSKYYNWTPQFFRVFYDILKRMDAAGVTITAAAGNWANTQAPEGGLRTTIDTYPQQFADPSNSQASTYKNPSTDDPGYIANMIIVGATSQYGKQGKFSQTASYLTTYGPGVQIGTLNDPSESNVYTVFSGTSYAAPAVAGLVGYLKQLKSKWQDQMTQANTNGPKAAKAMLVALQREIIPNIARPAGTTVPYVWNGMVQQTNCLLDFPGGGGPGGVCKDIPDDITNYNPPANCEGPRMAGLRFAGNSSELHRRADGNACSIAPGGGEVTLSFTSGATAGPTCASSCGGHVCSGYWCAPTPTGDPPGYQDPHDPKSSGATAPLTIIGSPPPTTTMPPTATYTTGLGVGLFTTCAGVNGAQCGYQWEIFTIPDGTATTFPGCDYNNALYSTVVDMPPSPSDQITLGPFEFNGHTCTFENAGGVVKILHCSDKDITVCFACAENGGCGGSQTCGPGFLDGLYRPDSICQIGS